MASKCLKTLVLKEKLTIFTMGSWVKLDLNTKKEIQLFQQQKLPPNKNKKRSKRKLVKKMSSKQDSTLLGWLEVLILHSIC